MKVWIVVTHEGYGGDNIEAVFADKKAAEAFMAKEQKDSVYRWRVIESVVRVS